MTKTGYNAQQQVSQVLEFFMSCGPYSLTFNLSKLSYKNAKTGIGSVSDIGNRRRYCTFSRIGEIAKIKITHEHI